MILASHARQTIKFLYLNNDCPAENKDINFLSQAKGKEK